MRKFVQTLAFMATALVFATPTKADLVGTTVTGTLTFGGGATNYFDKANGFVPPGFLNSGPGGTPTVNIAVAAIEYGFQDGFNLITADFTGSTLVIQDDSNGVTSFQMTFTNPDFIGLALEKIGDTYPPGGAIAASLVGSLLTIDYAGTGSPGTYQATFRIAAPSAVPEPGQFAMAGVASLFGAGAWLRRRSRRAA